MRGLILATGLAFTLVLGTAAPAARADADSGRHYYLSLGDSLAAGTNATEVGVAFTDLGYADQLHAALAVDDPKLKLVKLGCPGESSVSMRFGSQLPSVVGSCGTAPLLQELPLFERDAARRGGQLPRGAQGQGRSRHDQHRRG